MAYILVGGSSKKTNNLFEAIIDNNVKKVNNILMESDNVMELLNSVNNDNRTPLHHAIFDIDLKNAQKRINICALLIQYGANVNSQIPDNNNDTPLHNAVYINNVPVCELLLENGADIDLIDSYNKVTPLKAANNVKYHDMSKIQQVLDFTFERFELVPIICPRKLFDNKFIIDPENNCAFKHQDNQTYQYGLNFLKDNRYDCGSSSNNQIFSITSKLNNQLLQDEKSSHQGVWIKQSPKTSTYVKDHMIFEHLQNKKYMEMNRIRVFSDGRYNNEVLKHISNSDEIKDDHFKTGYVKGLNEYLDPNFNNHDVIISGQIIYLKENQFKLFCGFQVGYRVVDIPVVDAGSVKRAVYFIK